MSSDQEVIDKLREMIHQLGVSDPVFIIPESDKYLIVAGKHQWIVTHVAGAESGNTTILLRPVENFKDEDMNTEKNLLLFMRAEEEAFKKAGINFGTVTFICPLCGGKAVGVRYKDDSYLKGEEVRKGRFGYCNCGIVHS